MKNVSASVLARLKNFAKANSVVYNEVLQRYATERVLKRLELTPHVAKCILKGGTLFIVWSGGTSYRPTMDADLEYRGDGSPENLCKMFGDVAAVRCLEDDGLSVDHESIKAVPIREDDQYGGVRVTMTVHIGNVVMPVQFDVGIGDAVTPAPKSCCFPAILDFSPPRLKVYPRETVVAEKFQTIVKRGIANSRMKDYYDLWVLSKDPNVDRKVMRQAISRTFERRATPLPNGTPEGLSDAFATDNVKIAQWKAFLRKNRLDVGGLVLKDIVRSIYDFIIGELKT